MPKPRLVKALERKAAELFQRTRGISVSTEKATFVIDQVKLMSEIYGDAAIIEDFEKWAQDTPKDCRYPISEYLKVVDARLGTKADDKEEEIAKVTKVVFDTLNDIPTKSQIRHLLEKYPVEDIIEAFGRFVGGTDEKTKNSDIVRKFFVDGGCEAVMSTLYTSGV